MKDFIMLFIVFFVFILFFGGIIFTNVWVIIVLISMILATIAKGFINQSSKIEELEKKIEQLLQNKQD